VLRTVVERSSARRESSHGGSLLTADSRLHCTILSGLGTATHFVEGASVGSCNGAMPHQLHRDRLTALLQELNADLLRSEIDLLVASGEDELASAVRRTAVKLAAASAGWMTMATYAELPPALDRK
jgi:hypothetical protein